MNPTPFVIALLGFGCADEVTLPEVGPIDCSPEAASTGDALARVDVDGDGALTAADLAPGEIAAVVRWTGGDGPNGVAVHTSTDGSLYVTDAFDWDPTWSVPVPMDCRPVASSQLWFFSPDRSADALSVGEAELLSTDFIVFEHEMSEDESSVRVSGAIQVTDVGTDSASGHLEGAVSSGLFRRLGEVPWDQTYTVEALAFRDVPGTVALR